MTAFLIGCVVAVLALWQGRCWGWDRCARRNVEVIQQRERQFQEIIAERDRLYAAEIWRRDQEIARLNSPEPRMTATQLDEATFRVTRVSSESRTFGGNLGNPHLLAAAYNQMEFGNSHGPGNPADEHQPNRK